MTSRETYPQITTWHFLMSIVITCVTLTAIGEAQNPVPLINQPVASGTGTTVQLSPSTLSFSCRLVPNTCPPPPQSTVLTNTGGTTLTISGIKITGQYFSQTHNCPAKVQPHKSCTITVRFHSHIGRFTGAVSVRDNGNGSPQQVALSGTEGKYGMNQAELSAISATQVAAVPVPTGASRVGTRLEHMG